MKKEDIFEIAEGLRLIEKGVETIQNVMRENKIKSIKDMASELMPVLKRDDNTISDDIISHLDR